MAKITAFSSSLLIPGIATLELANWSLRQLTTRPRRALARAAIREATACAAPGVRRWLVHLVTNALHPVQQQFHWRHRSVRVPPIRHIWTSIRYNQGIVRNT